MIVSDYVTTGFQELEIEEIMRAPVNALLGVIDEQATVLSLLGIETIFDLAVSQVFADARRLLFPSIGENKWRSEDLYPRDLLNGSVEIPDDISKVPVQNLARVTSRIAASIKTQMGVQTVGELAVWPPYIAARRLAGLGVSGDEEVSEMSSAGIPAELIPEMNDQASEKAFYTVYSETMSASGRPTISGTVSLDLVAKNEARGEVTLGHVLRYEQSWTPIALTLGNLLHSLALAPGEATRIAITSWERQQSASNSENLSQNESLTNLTTSARTISEITSAVAREASEGFSNINSNTTVDNTGNAQYGLLNSGEALAAGGVGFLTGAAAGAVPGAAAGAGIGAAGGGIIGAFVGGIGAGPGAIGGGIAGGLVGAGTGALVTGAAAGATGFMGTANFGSDLDSSSNVVLDTVTVTSTDGTREIESEMMQAVSDQTQQQASSARTRTASIVQEVSQSESESVSTRVVANYNHMHAMTVQYFEVIQNYRQQTRLLKSEPCVYVPINPVREWTVELIRKYRGQLIASSLSSDFTFHLLAGYGTVGLHSPTFANLGEEYFTRLTDQHLHYARQVVDGFVGSNPHDNWRLPKNAQIVQITGNAGLNGPRLPGFESVEDETFEHNIFFQRIGSREPEELKGRLDLYDDDLVLEKLSSFTFEATFKPGQEADLQRLLAKPLPFFTEFHMEMPGKTGRIKFVAHASIDSSHIVNSSRGGRGKIVCPIMSVGPAIALQKAIDHLNENTEWYSRQILRLKNRELSRTLVDNLKFGSSVLGDHVDPEPVAINGNRLIFKLQSKDFRVDVHSKDFVTEELVPISTGGVFAEAVLGRANSAEKIDLTRFWNWQDSPIPLTPPEIAPVQMGSRVQAVNLTPGKFDAPLVQNTDARNHPDPQGTITVLNTLQQQLFKDMSGILETAQVAQTAMQQAVSASTATGDNVSENLQKGMEQTGRIVEQASKMVGDFGSMIAEKSLDVLNTGVSGALGATGGLGGSMGSELGGMGAQGMSVGTTDSVSGTSVSGATGPRSLGGLGSSATGIGGALNEARKIGGHLGASGTTNSPTLQEQNLIPASTTQNQRLLPAEIIRRATGVQPSQGLDFGIGRSSQGAVSDTSLQARVESELQPLVNRATRSDRDYDELMQTTLELLDFAQRTHQPEALVYDAVGDGLSRGWKAAALRAADRFNTGTHDAVHRILELETHRANLPNLIDEATFDLRALLKAEISIEDISAPQMVVGGEEITISGRVLESLSDGAIVPASGAEITLGARPCLPEHQKTSSDFNGKFHFVVNHGKPPLEFEGTHRFEGWYDLELNISVLSGRTALVAEKRVVVPGQIAVTLVGAFDNETGEDRLVGSVVMATTGKDITLQFRAMIAGQPLNRSVQLQPRDVNLQGEGAILDVTNPDAQGEFVVVFRPSAAAGGVAYISPTIRYGGFSLETPLREAPGFAALNII